MIDIHPTAVVSPEAELAAGVVIGPYCVIGPQVRIGPGTRLYSHVHIEGDTEIGRDNQIFPGAILGCAAQTKNRNNIPSKLTIGDENLIREYVTIHKSMKDAGCTRVGSRNVFMANSHIAHDCQLGNDIVMANIATLGGHVEVGDGAVIGGLVGVHQAVRIGRLVMVGGVSKVSKDVAPFCMVDGRPVSYHGINAVGLRRAGFDSQTRMRIKTVLGKLLRGETNLSVSVSEVRKEYGSFAEVREILDFIGSSKRGVTRSSEDVAASEEEEVS